MITKQFDCPQCNSFGKITIRGGDHDSADIVYCPVCSADISEEEEETLFDKE